jgi:hypothetical protein
MTFILSEKRFATVVFIFLGREVTTQTTDDDGEENRRRRDRKRRGEKAKLKPVAQAPAMQMRLR